MLYRNSNWRAGRVSSSFHSLTQSLSNIQTLPPTPSPPARWSEPCPRQSSHCTHPRSLRHSLFSPGQEDPVQTNIQPQHSGWSPGAPLTLNVSQRHVRRPCLLYVPQTPRHVSTPGHLHSLSPVPGTLFFKCPPGTSLYLLQGSAPGSSPREAFTDPSPPPHLKSQPSLHQHFQPPSSVSSP